MAYMSKTKKRRVRRQQLFRALIAIVVICAVLIITWQIGLGSTVAKVNGVSIRSGMVDGVEAFLTYYQTGQFPGDSTAGLEGEELEQAKDMALVSRNSMIQSVFISYEVIVQHFKANGTAFPDEDKAADIKETVDSMFANTDMARTFRANGVNKSHVEYYYRYLAAMSMYLDEVLESDPITDEEVLEYYEMYKPYFETPETLQASHILILDADHTAAKRAEIEAILEMLEDGADFAELAMEYSEDGSAENGGDLGEFSLGQMVAPFEEAALALEIGEISGIVETEFGFHIILLTGKTEAGLQTVDEVRDQLEELISSERLSAAIETLTEEADIVYFGLINPTTGKPPISLSELQEARGEVVEDDEEDYDEDAYDVSLENDWGDDYDLVLEDAGVEEEDDGHDHDHDHDVGEGEGEGEGEDN